MTIPDLPPTRMAQALERTHARFHYTADRYDNWRFPKITGRIKDDCDGFAPGALLEICNGSRLKFWLYLITFQAAFWHVTTPRGRGHLALWFRGWWCDNTFPEWYRTHEMPHKRRFAWPWPLVVWKYALGYGVRAVMRLKPARP